MSKKQFWIRFSFYVLFGLIIPMVFLVWRFKLFRKISAISVGGWGITVVIFSILFMIKLAKQVKKGLPFCFVSQLLNGLIKVILPLFMALLCLYFIRNYISEVMEFLVVLILSESVAIAVNPFPSWVHCNKLKEDETNFKIFIDMFQKKDKGV